MPFSGCLPSNLPKTGPTMSKRPPRRHPSAFLSILWAFAGLAPLGCGKGAAPVTAPVQVQFPPPPAWPYAAGAVTLDLSADPGLNTYEDRAHTLMVVVYQLSAVNAFNDLAKDPTGLQALLESGTFDQSVAGLEKLFVQPGDQRKVTLDRAQGARWIGVVAGYYRQVPGRTSSLVPIPTDQDRVLPLRVRLGLGRDALTFVEAVRSAEAPTGAGRMP